MTEEDKSIIDKAKEVATGIKEKVTSFVGDHEDQIHEGIDKTGDFVDEKITKGKFSEKIDKAQDAAKGAVSKLGGGDADDTPSADPPSADPPSAEDEAPSE